jgi:zinc transport system substrate-binding protein
MKKIIFMLTVLALSISLFACSTSEKYDIVATMYTHYTISKEIVGDNLSVTQLVPLGEGIHGFEASSQDMIDIENAKLFIYTSSDIDTWITDASSLGGDNTIVLDMSEILDEVHDHDEDASQSTVKLLSDTTEDEHDHSSDVHYWVDPHNAIEMAKHILEAIIEIDPSNEALYTENANQLIENIESAATSFETYIEGFTELPTIYVAGHNAFSGLIEHFGLTISTIFNEFQPDADLTSEELITFTNAVKNANAHYLFVDALEEPKAANAIKSELEKENYELTIITLTAYQNVLQDDFDASVTYSELLERNIESLKIALGA